MKTKKLAKALLSVALVMAMLFSMCIVGFVGASAAGLDLNYEFAYKNAGYAEGRLSLSGTSGTYILYWADDTGALEGYGGIAQITVSSGKKYFEMPENTAIPADATKVIAVKSGTAATVANASAVFDIPADKQFKAKSADKQYTFEALSDIHIQHDNSYWYLSKTHFANALEVAADRDVDFMTICGDMVNGYALSNLKTEYPQYLELIAKSNYNNPIYETNGNHEMKGGSAAENLDLYKKYTGLNTNTGALQSAPYYEKTINGDHYIFLVLEISGSPNESSEFTTAQLDWFEGLLKKYKNDGHKIIVNQHALIRGYGAGDNKVTPYYGGALRDSYADVKRLMSIMEAYPEIIMMNGHSHIDFKYGYNFDNENGNTCYTVHIPSTSSTTHPNSGGTTDYIMDANSSQGYLVDVYDDYVILNGTDLAFNLICPSYTYLVDYTGEELEKNELEDIVYDTVNVTVDISALTDAPTEVICVAVDETNAANNQQIPMTRNSDGTYSAKVIEEYSSVYFVVKSAVGQLNTSAFPVANCKIILGSQKLTYAPTGSVTTNVHAHIWGAGGDGTVWPGVAMTKGSDGNYSVVVPASEFSGVVFNTGSGGAQTTDLSFASYASDFVADVYINLDGDTTEPITQPTQVKPTEDNTVVTEPSEGPTKPAETDPSEIVTKPTEPSVPTTQPTDPAETTPTEPAKDELAPIVIVEETDEAYFLVDAYAADGAEDIEFKFAVSGRVVQDYSSNSNFIFAVGGDGMYILEVYAKYADGSEHKTAVMIEVKDGVAILPEMPERPTAPATSESTEPDTSTPDETVTTTVTVPTTETTAPKAEYLYGDADLDGKINIKDATTVQKYAAKLLELDETAFVQADVNGDTKVNVKDATAIQKYVAKLITVFPVEEGTAELASVGASSTLMNEVKGVLSKEYQYASYDAYMALKKAYMNNVSDSELTTAYNNYKTMKSKNSLANPGGTANIGDINIGQTGTGTPALPGPSIGGGSSGGNTGG
ncbi:MAG: starch-binding protein, partial [Ruminococcus sp.]|nr:starch-binding protein [Ruminococcus sp.]